MFLPSLVDQVVDPKTTTSSFCELRSIVIFTVP